MPSPGPGTTTGRCAATPPLVLLAGYGGRLGLFALARISGEAPRLYGPARLLPSPARRDWAGTLPLPAALLVLAAALGLALVGPPPWAWRWSDSVST